jgi:hypothetical protein
MAIQKIPLSQASENFFDQQLWQPLCNRHGREHALSFITIKRSISYFGESPDSKCGNQIYDQFLGRLVNEEIIASGIPPASKKPETIPAGLWRTLIPDFVTGEAISKTHHYSDVRLRLKQPVMLTDSIQRCVTWLEKRREVNGDEKKELLLRIAKEEKKGFTVRDFEEAYKIVYEREAGRPREDSRQLK